MTTERLAEDLISFSRLLRPGRRPELTPEQYWLLRHIRRTGPLSMGELAAALGITTGSATVACQRLEKTGMISRQRQAEDERIVIVALTDLGQVQIDIWRQQKRDALVQLLAVLNPDEQQELQRLIERLLEEADVQDFGKERENGSHH
ncbi:MAG TPA: MarR family transcriptional regulator [Ktedonobacteraceae bacterium]|nr:MarR family transcriptional regulator [Ktedonobacteraceae bacterium]